MSLCISCLLRHFHSALPVFPSVGIGAPLRVQLPVGAVPDGADQGRLIGGRGVDGAQVRGCQAGEPLTSDLLVKMLDGIYILLYEGYQCSIG